MPEYVGLFLSWWLCILFCCKTASQVGEENKKKECRMWGFCDSRVQIVVFLTVIPNSLVGVTSDLAEHIASIIRMTDGGSMFAWNVGKHLQDYMVLQPRRPQTEQRRKYKIHFVFLFLICTVCVQEVVTLWKISFSWSHGSRKGTRNWNHFLKEWALITFKKYYTTKKDDA
jgi:hypothetical protein